MCGIQLLLQRRNISLSEDYARTWAELTKANSRRGPDQHGETTLSTASGTCSLTFGAHVLHLRGPTTQSQPFTSASNDVFCWNGEVFSGLSIGANNDGLLLFARMQELKLTSKTFILDALREIEGPYAFVYFDQASQKLWFARDCLGRRSLVMHASKDAIIVSSVASGQLQEGWREVLAQTVYCIDLANAENVVGLEQLDIAEIKWSYASDNASGLQLPFDRVTMELAANHAGSVEPCDDISRFPRLSEYQPAIDAFRHELTEAIRSRVSTIPKRGASARVGILFSGGVDCITIAALLTRIWPRHEPIELFNVAFENPRQLKAHKTTSTYDVPDRKTGRAGWLELRRVDPDRDWRFVEVDVPYKQVLEHKQHICQLLVPSDTVMDLSIGMAIWFASRGHGNLVEGDGLTRSPYVGQARVLLLGMGADEQLGGYSRHRVAWERGQWEELGREIRVDVERIATRNLGRDDRIVSDNSKEARYPFLAANVVEFLSSTPLDCKMDMRYPRGMGEKLLLRLLAYQLGLTNACTLAKRAIQFGARTAKMETAHTKGHNRLQ